MINFVLDSTNLALQHISLHATFMIIMGTVDVVRVVRFRILFYSEALFSAFFYKKF